MEAREGSRRILMCLGSVRALWVRAFSVGGVSLALVVGAMAVAPAAHAANSAPTGISLAVADSNVAVNQGRITVTWNSVTDAVGYAVTTYLSGTTTVIDQQTVTEPTTSVVVSSLVGGQRYEITVATTDATGYGNPSSRSGATALTVPSPPQSVSVSATTNTSTVTWSRPTTEGGSPVLNYEVYVDGALNTTVSGSTTTATVNEGNLTASQVTVRALNSVGSSNVTTAVSTPGAPRSVGASASGSSVSVSWTAPLDNGGAAITEYVASIKSGATVVATSTVSASPASFANVADGTYSVEVRARNSSGLGAAGTTSVVVSSSSSTPVTPPPSGPTQPPADPEPSPPPDDTTVPDAPTNVVAIAGDASATISWDPPAASGGSAVIGYRVTSSPVGGSCQVTVTTCVVLGLTNDETYTFTVSAENSNGFSVESVPSNAVVPQADVTPEPEPEPQPEPAPEPTPEPSVGVIQIPGKIKTPRGARVRIVLQVEIQAPLRDLRLIATGKGKKKVIPTKFKRTKSGDIRAVFKAAFKPGKYRFQLVQIVDGKRVELDRTRLVVRRK